MRATILALVSGGNAVTLDLFHWAVLIAFCILVSFLTINWYLSSLRVRVEVEPLDTLREASVFLFDGMQLLSATTPADKLLGPSGSGSDWERLHTALEPRFPSFPKSPDAVALTQKRAFSAWDPLDQTRVEIEPIEDILRIELVEPVEETPDMRINPLTQAKLRQELTQLRDVTDCAPCPIWKTDATGVVVWHNAAYAELFRAATGKDIVLTEPLFAEPLNKAEGSQTIRCDIELFGDTQPHWYDLTCVDLDGARMVYAQNVTPVIDAKTTQRNFVQTLSKTFAQLSTGLAIFDQNLQLVLFNPALVDLTDLPAEFLAGRPNLLTFFDRLRDARVMPEPKDYANWREQMSAMVAAATDGSFCETWTLPNGSTYRINGRPHPDGAVAFLIEDISAEISMTRRFRADLELSQTILDELDDAVALFSAIGVMTLNNRAYRDLWQARADAPFAETNIVDACRDWLEVAGPNPLWGELRDFVLSTRDRSSWRAPFILPDGQRFVCSIHPTAHGATLLRIAQDQDVATAPQALQDWVAE